MAQQGSSPDRVATARRMVSLMDLTDLADDHSGDGIGALCARAAIHGTAAVCVWPEHVAQCASELAGTRISIATVVNFPTGEEVIADVVDQTARAIDEGAHEIDVVVPYRSFFADGPAHAGALLDAVRRGSGDHVLKVILESGELAGLERVRALTSFAVDRGADFVKTSTGKTPISATPGAVRAMLGVLRSHALTNDGGGHVGIKPSGGIRTFDDAVGYLRIADDVMGPGWATPSTFRFGASALLDALLEAMGAGEVGPA